MSGWKGLRLKLASVRDAPIELYDLQADIGETTNVADQHPDVVRRISEIMKTARTDSGHFPLPALPPPLPARPLIPKDRWKLVRVDSESKFNGRLGSCAFDGDPNTWWHTEWRDATPPHPHEIVIDLGRDHRIEGFRYFPRTDGGTNGMIKDYEFYVGRDPDGFGQPASKGCLEPGLFEQEVTFPARSGRFIKLRSLSAMCGENFTSVAEISLIGE